MLNLYKKAAWVFLALFTANALFAFLCINQVSVSDPLQPAHESAIPWKLEIITDVYQGGDSSLSIEDSLNSLHYQYLLTTKARYPSVALVLAFADLNDAEPWVDLSKYSYARFKVKCEPRSVLKFMLQSFDEKVTDPKDFSTYRLAFTRFSCNPEWSEIEIDLRHLKVPLWWLQTYQQEFINSGYSLEKVIAISIDNAGEGPLNTAVEVTINDLNLRGYQWQFMWLLALVSVLVWSTFIYWLVRQYTAVLATEVRNKFKQNRQFIAYQKLAIAPLKDRQKQKLLRFMVAEYTNPDMSLEYAIANLGFNRTKIYELLREETGLTFSAYLNQLRLVEAARLLAEQPSVAVAEIAYSVGYNNLSYFNRLFKQQYACTAKTFRKIYKSVESD